MRDGYSVVCETPLIGSKPSTPSGQRANPVSKALFQAWPYIIRKDITEQANGA